MANSKLNSTQRAGGKVIKPLLATVSPALLFFALSVSDTSMSSDERQACVCNGTASYDASLPASHPKNMCANKRQDVSWLGWLTGHNGTGQFHFVDLFELLYKKHSSSQENIPSKPGMMEE